MKICFVLEHFYPHVGGVETLFSELIKRLILKGNEVRVVTSDSGGITGTRDFHGATIHYFESRSLFGHPLLSERDIAEHVRWSDIVHTTTYTAAPTAYTLSKRYQKPCIITVHEAIGNKWLSVEKNPLKSLAFWLFEWFVVTKRYTAWHVVSHATETDLLRYGIDRKKIETIHLGIDDTLWNAGVAKTDITLYFGANPINKMFLYTGRPGKPKGIFVLLDAIRKLDASLDMSYTFGFILSNDPLSERIRFERIIKRERLTNRIFVADTIPYSELPSLRKSALAVIVPSLTEGFGFSAVETAALEVPVIASDAGSLPEVLGGKVLFFKNADSDDLAKKIVMATRNEFLCLEKKAFSWNTTADKLNSLYKRLCTDSKQNPII